MPNGTESTTMNVCMRSTSHARIITQSYVMICDIGMIKELAEFGWITSSVLHLMLFYQTAHIMDLVTRIVLTIKMYLCLVLFLMHMTIMASQLTIFYNMIIPAL